VSFALTKAVNPSKVFLTRKAEMTGRWDPSYFRPELVALEKRVCEATSHRLRDFVQQMAGGATPSTKDADTHYTESADGVPFIRVQNLSTTGRLNLEDCKRITRSTHEGLLARSKLSGGELLVKITGVGRMAVASVVPDGFEANINQHIVAIRTKDKKTSEALAAWLNLDSAERLASRRSTGGTRPALDYPALVSIPIVFDERLSMLVEDAVNKYQESIDAAKNLLVNIDRVLIEELGLKQKTESPNTIESRMFYRNFSALSGNRIDPASNWKSLSFDGGRYPLVKLRDVVDINPLTRFPRLDPSRLISFVPMNAVSEVFGEIVENLTRSIGESGSYTAFQEGDIIWAKITPCMENGKSAVACDLEEGVGFGSTEFHVFRRKNSDLSINFLHYLLRLQVVRDHARLNFTGTSGHQRVDEQFFNRMTIPFPPQKIQAHIAEKAEGMKSAARQLFADANVNMVKTKIEIEALILGKEPSI